jgi:hypothetical protein
MDCEGSMLRPQLLDDLLTASASRSSTRASIVVNRHVVKLRSMQGPSLYTCLQVAHP